MDEGTIALFGLAFIILLFILFIRDVIFKQTQTENQKYDWENDIK